MTFRTGVAIAGATVLLAGCGADDDLSEMHATLTDDDCTYEGNTTHAAGMFYIEIENQTQDPGKFGLVSVPGEEDEADARAVGSSLDARPSDASRFRGVLHSAIVDGGASTFLPVDVTPGTYVLVCWDIDQGEERAEVATQLDATG